MRRSLVVTLIAVSLLSACATQVNTTRPATVSTAVEDGYKQKIGKTYWANPKFPTEFASVWDLGGGISHTSKTKVIGSFTINDFKWVNGTPVYFAKNELSSKETLIVNAATFDESRFMNEAPWMRERREKEAKLTEERAAKTQEKKRLDDEKAERDAEIKAEVDKQANVISREVKRLKLETGSVLWTAYRTRHPERAGLSKATIRGLQFEDQYRTPKTNPVTNILVNLEFGDGEKKAYEVGTIENSVIQFDKRNEIEQQFYRKLPAWGKRIEDIRNGVIFIGMTSDQMLASRGSAKQVNDSVGPWGTHEQWVYGDYGPYYYFENGRLTSMQSGR